jgi:hypothetical protein
MTFNSYVRIYNKSLRSERQLVSIEMPTVLFGDFQGHIFLILLVFQNTTGIRKSALKLDLYTEIYDETRLTCNLYDKCDDFKSQIVSFPFLCSNITAEHARGAYISPLIRYPSVCAFYLDSPLQTPYKRDSQDRLKSSRQTVYGPHHEILDHFTVTKLAALHWTFTGDNSFLNIIDVNIIIQVRRVL